jgi:hypothetical protein
VDPGHCARPACYGAAAAWLAYDYDARCAWLDDDATDAGPEDRRLSAHVWPLCERHADTLKVPRGWFCVDRRASRFGLGDGDVPPVPATGAEGTAAGAGPAKPGGTRDNDAGPQAPGAKGGGRLSSIL